MIKEEDKKYILGTYNRFDVVAKSGKGATLEDENGKKYIDFTSGIGVNSLGFCNDDWINAIKNQAEKLNHISNLFYTTPGVELAKNLCQKTGYDKLFFGNIGAEAHECAIKNERK